SVIDWVMCAESVSFRHAVELLRREHLPLAVRPGAKPPQRSSTPKLPAPVRRDADDRALLLQVAHYYHEALKNSPDALKYLQGRGLTSSEMIEQFQLGFANRTLGYGLPEKNRVAGADLRGRLQKLGIFRDTGHEHFNGSVVIPIFNLEGEVVEMYGRKITRALRENTPLHSYLPGPMRGVWNEQALVASKEIILCEALIDALTLWCAGFRHVTASYGVNGFTPAHWQLLDELKPERIVLCYDNDQAGNDAAAKLAEQLKAKGVRVLRAKLPPGKDVNDVARENKNAQIALATVLEGSGARPVAKPATANTHAPTATAAPLPPVIASQVEPPKPAVAPLQTQSTIV